MYKTNKKYLSYLLISIIVFLISIISLPVYSRAIDAVPVPSTEYFSGAIDTKWDIEDETTTNEATAKNFNAAENIIEKTEKTKANTEKISFLIIEDKLKDSQTAAYCESKEEYKIEYDIKENSFIIHFSDSITNEKIHDIIFNYDSGFITYELTGDINPEFIEYDSLWITEMLATVIDINGYDRNDFLARLSNNSINFDDLNVEEDNISYVTKKYVSAENNTTYTYISSIIFSMFGFENYINNNYTWLGLKAVMLSKLSPTVIICIVIIVLFVSYEMFKFIANTYFHKNIGNKKKKKIGKSSTIFNNKQYGFNENTNEEDDELIEELEELEDLDDLDNDD